MTTWTAADRSPTCTRSILAARRGPVDRAPRLARPVRPRRRDLDATCPTRSTSGPAARECSCPPTPRPDRRDADGRNLGPGRPERGQARYTSSEILDTEDPDRWEQGPEYNTLPLDGERRAASRRVDGRRRGRRGLQRRKRGHRSAGGYDYTDELGERRQVEIFDPKTGTWTLGPPSRRTAPTTRPRCCFPTAGCCRPATTSTPLTTGAASARPTPPRSTRRPTCSSRARGRRSSRPPTRSTTATSFTVQASAGASRAVLMAPGAATHGVDMQQRHVELRCRAPGRADVAASAVRRRCRASGPLHAVRPQLRRRAVGRRLGPPGRGAAGAAGGQGHPARKAPKVTVKLLHDADAQSPTSARWSAATRPPR